ncbi:hypothetical protein DFH06DRAFT_1329830 [Mycena polygramma]|nr:hypothetical protein DFH06DRAFT_1329830 [Mycena polygramma]
MPGPPPPYSVSDPHIRQGNDQVDALVSNLSSLNISGGTHATLRVGNRPQTPSSHPVPAPVTPPRPVRRYQFRSPTRSGTTTEWSEASHLTQGVPQATVRSLVRSPKKRPKNNAYVVFYGIIPGVYDEWYGPEGAEVQVTGVPGSLYQGYPSTPDAGAAFDYARERNWTGVRTRHPHLFRGISAPPPSSSAIGALPVPTPLLNLTHNPLHGPVTSDTRTWYIVYAGITPGIYLSQYVSPPPFSASGDRPHSLECALNTVGLSGARHDSADSLQEAQRRWNVAVGDGTIHFVTHPYH